MAPRSCESFARDVGDPAGRCQRNGSVSSLESQPVRPRLERDAHRALLPGLQQLLEHDVRRHLRTAHAVLDDLDLADRGIRARDELDRAVEVRAVVDAAGVAMEIRVQIRELRRALLGAAAERAEQVPAQIEQAGTGCPQAELEDAAAIGAPGIGQPVGAKLGKLELVTALDRLDEPAYELGVLSGFDERSTAGPEPFLASSHEPGPGRGRKKHSVT